MLAKAAVLFYQFANISSYGTEVTIFTAVIYGRHCSVPVIALNVRPPIFLRVCKPEH